MGDICYVEAKYHSCIQSFMRGDYEKKEAINPRNINDLNSTAFDQFCEKLNRENLYYKQYTLEGVRMELASCLPSDIPVYSTKHRKRKIMEIFGDEVSISEQNRVPDVITFKEKAATIFRESYLNESVENDDQVEENIKIARSLGKTISNDLEALPISEEYYPNSYEVDLEKVFLEIPITVSSPIESIFPIPPSVSAMRK